MTSEKMRAVLPADVPVPTPYACDCGLITSAAIYRSWYDRLMISMGFLDPKVRSGFQVLVAVHRAMNELEQLRKHAAPVVTPVPQPPGTHAWRCNQCETVIVLNEGAEFPDDCSGCHRTTGWVREVAVKQRRPAALAPPQQETPREPLDLEPIKSWAAIRRDKPSYAIYAVDQLITEIETLRARALPRETPTDKEKI